MSTVQALVVDDDQDVCELLGGILSREGLQVSLAADGQQGLTRLEQQPFQILFTDLRMPDMDGLTVLRHALRKFSQLSSVVFTGHGDLDSCVEAMRLGACDYVTKPFTVEAIRAALTRALDFRRSKGRDGATREALGLDQPDELLAAKSPAMRKVCDLVAKVAPTDAAVLIRGEPGVGKQRVAQAIHRQSRRAQGFFVPVACGMVRESELNERLFGLERRFGDGREPLQRGLLETAQDGTLFLADVDLLPVWAQVQLFDVLQRGRFRSGADFQAVPLDVRLIASASCDMETAVESGRFYSGLYYLLNVVAIHVPPLRERRDDIKILAERCLAQALAKQGITDPVQYHFTKEAWQFLLSHPWPGNIPELVSAVNRAVALSYNKEIGDLAMIGAPRKSPGRDAAAISVPLSGNLHQIEQYIIEQTIERCGGNKAAAARALGLHRRTLYRMLEEEDGDTQREEA
jgi:DNA-binding NtrC family response regulator